ncbi:hypothetical protein Glove_103g207 [Diversispora epigaea]|uniref:Protein kinase domain-containing protein n=1 Tax=Diversispora epigaea TaxID=1348612 RepID=A0A397J7N3_9GLOM|nr:hypothetical protein Glove_103g207 [Diversispora epigaea]
MTTQKIGWNDKLNNVWDKIYITLNFNKTITQQEEYRKNMIRNDSSLTKREKKFLLDELQIAYDKLRIGDSSVEKQATQYCEFCIRKYLKNNFRNWTSGNDEIDKLIQECQQKTVSPQFGRYNKWNSEKQILERLGRQKVILKRLNNSNSNNVHWFQEMTLNFTLDNTFDSLALCHGLTKDPSTHDYMLITRRLFKIHKKNIMHRDLHSGNILYNAPTSRWFISDLGLSGPVDKPLNSIYGNFPYIAPEVYCGQIFTTKSDIYSIDILMWEVITGETPYAFAIASGYRPTIYENIPLEYETLMKQCWDANPDNRLDAVALNIKVKIRLLIKSLYYKQVIKNIQSNKNKRGKIYKTQTSKVYAFNFSIQPRNVTDEKQQHQEVFLTFNTIGKSLLDKLEEEYEVELVADGAGKLYKDAIGEIKCLDLQFQYKGK